MSRSHRGRTKPSGWPRWSRWHAERRPWSPARLRLGEIITADSGALADNNPTAIAEAVTAIVSRPEEHRRAAARRRAEMFTWQRAAVDMLTTLGAASFDDDPGDSQHTA